MPFSYDILDRNAWATEDQSGISQLVTASANSEAAWRNEEESSGQPAGGGDEAQAGPNASDDQIVCRECEECPAIWYCKECRALCDECWFSRGPHKRKSPAHQRITLNQFKLFERILDPDSSTLDSQHRDDDDSLWFSVDGDTGSLEPREFPRFGAIVSEHQRQHSPQSPPYPRLVSFVGKTGEGKSAIIRLLIEHLWDETARRRMITLDVPTKAPVVGPRQRSIPTSGDVHLYYDTLMDEDEAVGRPLLYADCEGFGAGTQRPTYHHGRRGDDWRSVPGLPDIRRWQDSWRYLLYNFSDVVVNVMQSHSLRQIDDSIVELLEWAEVSHISATNRFGLPHLIIVVNRSDDNSNWDPIATGQQILTEQQRILEGNDKVRAMADRFRGVGIEINTLEDLLLTSYAQGALRLLSSAESLRPPPAKMAARLSELMIATFKVLDTNGDRNSIASRFSGVMAPLVCSIMALDAARSFKSLAGRWVDIFCGETDQTAQSCWGSNKNSYKVQVV
ncbi:phospholipase A I [Fusarium subglutinans]|uniref:Phospholipase A I n=1 Tax=Gibberella subglutinans TaxID=42677 RepID=A0A8H5L4Z6_GIBSU|nr:phospholipase A I [Fusarium subglutinans]KAF5585028.1 phospholipase A I [Fusarium subglutinans]